jgi:hypothetical protein
MATTTPNFGFDVPTSTDYVKDGALAIETLGDDIDERFGDITNYPNQIVNRVSGVSRPLPFAMAGGTATISAPAAVNTISSVSVTFPASRFTQAPLVNLTAATSASNPRAVKVDAVTTSGFTASQWQLTGATMQSTNTYWVAIQMTSAASAG